jgi:serine-type D-Ala-D-Ala carboxypeptidase (penicillin-binding protein 5/6)
MKNRNALRVKHNESGTQLKTLPDSLDLVFLALSHITHHALRITVFLFLLFTFHLSLFTAVYGNEIESKAAVVLDASTGRVLYAKNPELRLHPASTTKLMTALVTVDKMKLSDVVTVSRRAAGIAPIRTGFRAGDRVTIETLLYAALMKSGNDAAVALAEAVAGSEWEFVKLMNRKALAIGANDTRFVNASGLPGKGQYITAYDLSKIMSYAIRYPVLKEILGTRITELSTEKGKTMFIKSTNKLLWSDDYLVGGKTGYTNQAKHCFVCAGERENETIIVALLGSPRRELLWTETEDLLGIGSRILAQNEEPVIYLTKAAQSGKAVSKIKKKRTKKKPVIAKAKKSAKKKPVVTAGKKNTKKKQIEDKTKNKKDVAEKPVATIESIKKNLAQKGKGDDEG